MQKNRIDANVRCPSCNGQLYPRVLVCEACGLKVEGDFIMNEFGSLTPDELHFLRVFIYCEGRIRDMEAALGVSYPTVKAHLSSIKKKLNLSGPKPSPSEPAAADAGEASEAGSMEGSTPDEVLKNLEDGRISYKEAVRLLRTLKRGEERGDKGTD
jgi:hypothetical protein